MKSPVVTLSFDEQLSANLMVSDDEYRACRGFAEVGSGVHCMSVRPRTEDNFSTRLAVIPPRNRR